MPLQGQFNFQANDAETGYIRWMVVRQMAAEEAARKLNLPLGRKTEVWLRGDVRLRGKLRLRDNLLFIEENQIRSLPLEVDGVTFTYSEIESCVSVED